VVPGTGVGKFRLERASASEDEGVEDVFTRPFVCDISEDTPVVQLRFYQGCSSAAYAILLWMGVGVSYAKSKNISA
jgi:hypothetical protein